MTSKKLPAARAEEPVMRFDEKGAELRDRLRGSVANPMKGRGGQAG